MSVPSAAPRPMPVARRASRVRFRRAIALLAMTLVLPGSAQLVHGHRAVGRWALRVWAVLVAAVLAFGVTALCWHEAALWVATTPAFLGWLRIALIVLGLCWGGLFVDAWRLGEPLSLEMGQRRTTVLVNAVMAFSVVAALLFGAHLVNTQRGLMVAMFAGDVKSDAVDGRYNVLLIGADSGLSRWGTRTDSMTLASIDASTGRTVLIGLPRNMENFPFVKGSVMRKQFPHGYDCATCELNSLTTYADGHQSLFPGVKYPGVEATIEGIEGITGLKVNYWAMVNLQGFRALTDALGGVTVDVRQPIAIGPTGAITGWIKPGVQKLSGDQLLWYVRSRATSDDYSRMARQKCVMNAMLHQLSPTQVLAHYGSIAKAGEAIALTSIPTSEVDTFLGLALKARSQPVSTISLVPPLVDTLHPDIKVIRSAIAKAIDPPAKAPAKRHHTAPPATMTEGSFGSMATGYTANQTSNLSAAC